MSRRALALASAAVMSVTGVLVTTAHVESAGAATASYSPYGSVEKFVRDVGGVYLRGWAVDPSSPRRSISVYVTVDGKRRVTTVANRSRPGVAAAHPGAGAAHGFAFVARIPEGRHTICVWAKDIYRGSDKRLACRTRTLDYGPSGNLDYVRPAHGAISIKGWAADRDAQTKPVSIRVSVDGIVQTLSAAKPDKRASAIWPAAGTAHGYSAILPVSQGAHRVCVVAENISYGSDTSFGCHSITLDESPTGAVDILGQRSGSLRVRGWTYDVDSPTTPLSVTVTIDGQATTLVANRTRDDIVATHKSAGAAHGFDLARTLAQGTHRVQVVAHNLDLGRDRVLADRSVRLNFTPSASLVSLTAGATDVRAQGWAIDPDTSSPIRVRLTVDGKTAKTVTANHAGAKQAAHRGRNFTQSLVIHSGTHTVCAIGLNVLYGTANSAASCRTIVLAFSPLGKFETATRDAATNGIRLTGWAFDPDTTAPLAVAVTIDAVAVPDLSASVTRPDIAQAYPGTGSAHGISALLPGDDGEHKVCLTARNVGGGKDRSLGCRIVNAVHPVAPSAPQAVQATGSYQAVVVSWTPPASDGGAPPSKFVVVASPGGRSATVGGTATTATVTGLKQKAKYRFTVRAVNVAGTSAAATSPTVSTLNGPAPQRSPAPVATSRYIRNIRGSSAAELALMRAEGVADARSNPANHRYLVLLDIGGQDQANGGVVLSATTRFVPYADLVRDLNAYVSGYHSAQRGTAPATIALGTNNDMDVTRAAGAAWATNVVNRITSYPGLAIAGANDIEPGFRASYAQTRNWLSGYLAGTSRRFVFNGSADGCAWTVTNRRCNNGWSMAGLYALAAGAAPTRMINLPQIYNTTMAAQWKYISLTGVTMGQQRINFGGPLTELTACRQVRSCGSLSGRTAWSTLWRNLQSDSRLRVGSLPYATDLRIDS